MRHWVGCALVLVLASCGPALPNRSVERVQAEATVALPAPTPQPTAAPPTLTAALAATPTPLATATPPATLAPTELTFDGVPPAYSYPIGWPARAPGDGFVIRHGFQTENTWYNPGHWHTGEDWYALAGQETAGALVYVVAAGVVVYAGANYPGRVVIVQHAEGLLSMYGHLDPALAVAVGQSVQRGQSLGAVLRRADNVPNHLHFELRSFLTADPINGPRPRYGFRCGANCPPGPGYWPIDAPELPGALGWVNPTHAINTYGYVGRTALPIGLVVVATPPVSPSLQLWSAMPGSSPAARVLRTHTLTAGERYALLAVSAGPLMPPATSADSYQLWYRIALPDAQTGWVHAAVPLLSDTGGDGRPSSVSFNFLPAITNTP